MKINFWGKFGLAILALMLLVTLAYATSGRHYEGLEKFRTTIITKTLTAAQNNYVLFVSTVHDTETLIIDKFICSAATATYIYWNDSNVANACDYGWIYIPTNASVIDNHVNMELDARSGIYINCGGACKVQFEYHEKE